MIRHATKLLIALGLTLGFVGCDIDQTREGEMPEIEVRGGQAPEYDVDPLDVDVTTESETVEVPNIDVNTERRQVEMPNIDIHSQDDAEE